MNQKLLFIADCARELDPVTEVCRRYGVSRKTSYKWIERFKQQGFEGLRERTRRPLHCPTAIGRLLRLSIWWIRLGIFPELIEPGHPEQNPRHERMHRTLKADTTKPPSQDHNTQQKRFDAFRHLYNHERPHESLGQQTPATFYRPSERTYPSRLPKIEYPGHFEVRRVSRNGGIRWNSKWVCVSHVLGEEYVGFDEVDDGLWEVF